MGGMQGGDRMDDETGFMLSAGRSSEAEIPSKRSGRAGLVENRGGEGNLPEGKIAELHHGKLRVTSTPSAPGVDVAESNATELEGEEVEVGVGEGKDEAEGDEESEKSVRERRGDREELLDPPPTMGVLLLVIVMVAESVGLKGVVVGTGVRVLERKRDFEFVGECVAEPADAEGVAAKGMEYENEGRKIEEGDSIEVLLDKLSGEGV